MGYCSPSATGIAQSPKSISRKVCVPDRIQKCSHGTLIRSLAPPLPVSSSGALNKAAEFAASHAAQACIVVDTQGLSSLLRVLAILTLLCAPPFMHDRSCERLQPARGRHARHNKSRADEFKSHVGNLHNCAFVPGELHDASHLDLTAADFEVHRHDGE